MAATPRMHRPALLLVAMLAAPALADAPLDLRLPAEQAEASAWRTPDDDDGAATARVGRTYEGDTRAAPPPARRGRACPAAADGSERAVTGSVTTGIGHASRGGNSNWNAVDLNLCREYVGDSGDTRTVNLGLHVGRYDGPGYIGGLGHGPGGFDGFGPGHAADRWLEAPARPMSFTSERRPWR